MFIRCVVLFSVLLWLSTDSNGCEFPDFRFSMKSVKNKTGEWVVKVNLDHKKGRPWDIYINKTTDKSKCHQAILLVVTKDEDNTVEETPIPDGFSAIQYQPYPSDPLIISAKKPPPEVRRHPSRTRQNRPTRSPDINPGQEFPYIPPEQPVNNTQQSNYKPEEPQYGYPRFGEHFSPKPVPTPKPTPPTTTNPPPTTTSKSPPRYYKYVKNHTYYKIHHNRWTWQEARDKCQSEGSDLAVINSESEALALGDFINKEGSRKYDLWVGFHGKEDRDWLTIHNQTLKEAGFERWWPGQPDYSPGYEQCGIFKYESTAKYGLIDLLCTHDSIFICEWSY